MGARSWKLLSSPLVLAVSALMFFYFLFAVLPAEALRAARYTPPGAAFDTSFAYSAKEAIERAAAYSTEGRFQYIAARWSFDLLWPAVYGLFAFSAWSLSLGRLAKNPGYRRLAYLALLGPAFDYGENIAVTGLMAVPAESAFGWALAASIATPLKWIFVALGLGGGGGLLLATAIRGLRVRKRDATEVPRNHGTRTDRE